VSGVEEVILAHSKLLTLSLYTYLKILELEQCIRESNTSEALRIVSELKSKIREVLKL
jgi:hypothetical protein